MATKKSENAEAKADEKLIETAIAEGRTLIDQGKSKIDAAMAIYRVLEQESQETVVSAFIDGAGLTPKGALTYWYNCRKRLAREKREQESKQVENK